MATSNNSLNTHYVSTVSAVRDCLNIILYNSEKTDYNVIRDGLDVTFNKIRQKLISQAGSQDFEKLTRSSTEDYFVYECAKVNTHGFDVIIYLDTTLTTPLGYTLLNNVQGIGRNINIILNLTSSISGESSIDLVNSFNHLLNTSSPQKNFLGKNPFDYTSSDQIINNLPSLREIYTNNLSNVTRDDTSMIYLGDSVIKGDYFGNLIDIKLNILRNRRIDPFRVGFDHFNVDLYKNDLALYEWKYEPDGEVRYCIYSLTIKNKFGDLLQYIKTKSNEGYISVPREKDDRVSILFGTGRFLLCNFNGKLRLLNTEYEDPIWVDDLDDFVVDRYKSTVKPYQVNSPLIYTDLLKVCPNILNTFLDFKDLVTRQALSLVRQLGNWILLKQESKNLMILAGKYSTIYLTEKDLDKLIVINDSSVLFDCGDTYRLYNTLYSEYYTDSAALISGKSSNLTSSKVINKQENLFSTELNNYRRNSYPIDIVGIPNIIDACCGLIFYLDDKRNINYL